MYEVYKFVGKPFKGGKYELQKVFKTFEEAHKFAVKLFPDVSHAQTNGTYWMSDNNNANSPYQIRIDKI